MTVQVRELSREDVEKDFTFVGFIVISCPLKPDSKAVVREIHDASHHVGLSIVHTSYAVITHFWLCCYNQ